MRTARNRSADLFFIGVGLLAFAGVSSGQPRGPEAVARQEPNRVVAVIAGANITARQAWDMLKMVTPQVRAQRAAELPKLFQQVYMQRQIAVEATKLHLDRKAPWAQRLQHTHMVMIQGVENYPGEPEKDLPPGPVAAWHNARDKILRDAYYGQAPTKEARAALVAQEREKYKIEVRDPSFFNGATS